MFFLTLLRDEKQDVAGGNNARGSYNQMTERVDGGGGSGRDLQGQVFQFTTSVTKFQKQVALLGTRRDTQEQRLKINALGKSIKELAKEISEGLKSSGGSAAPNSAKLVQDFQQVVKEFQKVYRECLDKMSTTMPQVDQGQRAGRRRNKAPGGAQQGPPDLLGGPGSSEDPGVAQEMESQMLLDNQIDHHDVLIAEREEGIREIQGQIAEVRDIFQDLAVLVNEQGDMVNDIESNIISSHGHTQQAGKELIKAASHQKSARNRMCMIAVIMVVVIIVIVLLMQ